MAELLMRLAELATPPLEVIVVDGSPDRETEVTVMGWAQRNATRFDLIYVKSMPGLTRQKVCWQIDVASREFVFFLDDDCIPSHGYFEAMRGVFLEDTSRKVGGVRRQHCE